MAGLSSLHMWLESSLNDHRTTAVYCGLLPLVPSIRPEISDGLVIRAVGDVASEAAARTTGGSRPLV